MNKTARGFTIVELLIVIVVIAILATISIVVYNGVQGRARDSKRYSDLKSIASALELYRVDQGGYPKCTGGTHRVGDTEQGSTAASCLTTALVPKYMASFPVDPINTTPSLYWYGVGYRKTGVTTLISDNSDNYILGARMDSSGGSTYNGWSVSVNYLAGSSN